MVSRTSQFSCIVYLANGRLRHPHQCRCHGRFFSAGLGTSSEVQSLNSRGKYFTLDPVEMEPVFGIHLVSYSSEEGDFYTPDALQGKYVLTSGDETAAYRKSGKDKMEQTALGAETTYNEESLAINLHNTIDAAPYRVAWYDYGPVSPAKRFTYCAYRRLQELSPDWQEYYPTCCIKKQPQCVTSIKSGIVL
ncbi:hypothetical protein TraAM80_08236 [Trypanosoma rangeli]|uniref:Uncharacterized protein n=1 Tax=Trypanosoma rangeli TaxID=5698 RepID=A0A422N1M8_TRYRA|nr:uncharacterized protein TraAM80_08236 [Trypanosoma rangeli]RNE99349.1 hypothetical protein TraAM80_08236 [Trypanosoma rangeli]|eukprot:RNE99349.1 hypothetical protein TraAM80_08236 [Trypanosoma rangeli]